MINLTSVCFTLYILVLLLSLLFTTILYQIQKEVTNPIIQCLLIDMT